MTRSLINASPASGSIQALDDPKSKPPRTTLMTDDLIERLRIAAHSLREEGFPPAPLLLDGAATALRTASERIVELEKALKRLLMTYLDEDQHGGDADDADCSICAAIREGQDALRTLILGEEGNSSSVDSRAPGYMARSDTPSDLDWRPIESAPRDGVFVAIDRDYEVRRCWRHNPSSRTDEILTWKTKTLFKATHWAPLVVPSPAGKGEL